MFRALNFILISLLSWSAFAQQPIVQAKAYLSNQAFEEILFISIKEQKLYHIKDDQIIKEYVISSSAQGIGSEAGSNKTPIGLHKVKQKYGEKTPINGRMVGRVFYGEIANIYTGDSENKTDDITSRIFWLEGLEKEKNKGKGIDSYKRYIYIHGTSEEGLLGSPASHGCIRMKNKEVIDLYSLIEVGTLVLIL